jgi:hypothetical protein
MTAIGTSRHFAVVPNDGRDRSEADMPRPLAPYQSDATDPKRTRAWLKCRSAAVFGRARGVLSPR